MDKEQIEFHNKKYLIPYKGKLEVNTLEELMLAIAKSMEYSLQEAGAKKGEDYKILDLFELAKPFAMQIFSKENSEITFAIE